jgi:enamine deaminase RidA (YjgF/YER057c/UK114 family)
MTFTELQDTIAPVKVNRQAIEQDGTFVSRIESRCATKLYVCVRPIEGGDFTSQAREIYRKLRELLRQQGGERQNVITEKIFFSDIANQVESFRKIREEAYLGGNGSEPHLPATTYLHQPPLEPDVLCELQARVIIPGEGEEMTVTDIEGLPEPAAGKIVSYRGYDHIYLQNLTGGKPGDGLDYAGQMEEVFDRAEEILEREGLTFKDVIRTWLYLDEMERDYADLNRVRTAFFKRVGVERMPASTGIEGGVYPCDRGGSMDLYALRTERSVEVKQMHAPTLNEAWSYGSSFARGMTVTREDRTVAYVSGTASIDTEGKVVHVGDIEGQCNRMLLNVEELLEGSGADKGDIVRATTYLKHPEDFEVFKRVYAERGFPLEIPHTICDADVCRPDWLVEIEVAAIFPPSATD